VVALDLGGIAQAALDNIGINRTLHQKTDLADFFSDIFKAADKLLADNLSLLFGVCDACEFCKEPFAGVDSN